VVRLRGRYQACDPGSRNGHGQRDLWGTPHQALSGPVTKAQIPALPILAFDDGRGAHELQLIDWGSVLLLHKGYDLDALAGNLGIGDPTRAHLLLVGNQQNARTSWLVIACVPIEPTVAESEELSLFTWANLNLKHRSDA
jgi:hypothetical protein